MASLPPLAYFTLGNRRVKIYGVVCTKCVLGTRFGVMDVYSCEDLYDLKQKPKINDISLNLLCEYYKKYLLPFEYRYTFEDTSRIVVLDFKKENFCHLLGIESVVKKSISKCEIYNYKGITGWNNIENSLLTFNELKRINKKKFNSVKAKYVYFYLIPKLIDKPFAVKYNKSKVNPSTDIKCEVLFYNQVQNDNAIVHLGIGKEKDNCYYPRTFFVEKTKKFSEDKYIRNQDVLIIKNTTIINKTY